MRGIVVAVAMGLTGPAQAADWVRPIQTGDGSTFYIDKSSISGPLEQRQVWVKFDHTTKADPAVTPESDEEAELRKRGLLAEGGNIRLVPFRPPENPVETKQLWLFRCHDGTLAISSSITDGANGKVLNSTHIDGLRPLDFDAWSFADLFGAFEGLLLGTAVAHSVATSRPHAQTLSERLDRASTHSRSRRSGRPASSTPIEMRTRLSVMPSACFALVREPTGGSSPRARSPAFRCRRG